LPAAFPALDGSDTESAADFLTPPHKAEEFATTNEADFAYSLDGSGRFRVNVLRQRGTVALAIRRVSSEGQTFAELQLPPVVQSFAEARRGLTLVTGPTGSGKTTTIASMIGFINRTRRAHIVTIEDPIEVIHTDDMSVIWQREIGPDTASYAVGLRQVLRQDPDVIFLGEIRDADSALAAIQAAQTGDLPEIIADSDFDGMQLFDQALMKLVQGGLVAEEDARAVATNPHDLSLALRGAMAREGA